MYRSLNKIFVQSLKQIKYTPKVVKTFKNWFGFFLNHLRIKKDLDEFILRNGLKIKVDRINDDGWSPSIIMDICIKNEYGFIKNNSVLIDIGANIGVFSLFSTFKKNNICYAFEPEERNFAILKENIKINNLEKAIIPFNIAVSDVNGEHKLYKTISMSHSLSNVSDEFEIVKTVTLESIIKDNNIKYVDYLKIDCEGGEYDILYNTNKNTFKIINKLLIEYHNVDKSKESNGEHLINYIQQMGYSIVNRKIISDRLGIVHAELIN